MKELGDYLRETRENNCVGLEEASDDLNISVEILENIESGNTRAFRDMYELKDKVKEYAKYLGLDPDKVVDEFNDFFFEHTSKISLSDILEAENNDKKEKKEMSSPYTTKRHKKINKKYLSIALMFLGGVIIIGLIAKLILYFILPKDTKINRELYNENYIEVIV